VANSNRVLNNIFTIKELISLPIQTVIEADIFAAQSAIKLIQQYGFDDYGQLRMFSFTYRFVDRGREQTMRVEIPFLALIPLPLLEIKHAEFRFGMQILDQVSETRDSKEASDLEEGKPEDNSKCSREVLVLLATPMGDLQPTNEREQPQVSYQRSTITQANMDVYVRVGRASLPAGIQQLLNLSQEATQGNSKPSSKHLTAYPNELHFSKNNPTQLLRIEIISDDPNEKGFHQLISVGFMPPITLPGNALTYKLIQGKLLGAGNFPLRVKPVVQPVQQAVVELELTISEHVFDTNRSCTLQVTYLGADPIEINLFVEEETRE
jgi:hypothetical protein